MLMKVKENSSPPAKEGKASKTTGVVVHWYHILRTDADPKNNHPLTTLAALLRRRAVL